MRMALRTLGIALVAGLALAPSAFADNAILDLNVAREACGGTADQGLKLSASLGAFTSSCGSTLAAALPNDDIYATPTGEEHFPLPLDTSRPIHVAIDVTSYLGVAVGGVGDETVTVTLTGRRGNTNVALGSGTTTTPAQTMLTQAHKLYEFDLPLTADKAGTYKSFSLELQVGGSEGSSYVDDGGASKVSIPTFDYVFPPEDDEE